MIILNIGDISSNDILVATLCYLAVALIALYLVLKD